MLSSIPIEKTRVYWHGFFSSTLLPNKFLSDPPVSMALPTAGPVRQASSLKIVKKEDEARSHD